MFIKHKYGSNVAPFLKSFWIYFIWSYQSFDLRCNFRKNWGGGAPLITQNTGLHWF